MSSRSSTRAAAFVNCIPVFIASQKYWQKRFQERGLPVIGDDIKSQVGATILHRTLVNLYLDRGMLVDRTYQLNTGGNTDFLNMLERERLDSKKKSKTNAVVSQIRNRGLDIEPANVHVGPSDYVPWQKDNKVCFLRIESRHFGDVPTNLECRLSVEDSPNSAGVVIDAIRCVKLALDERPQGLALRALVLFHEVAPETVHRHGSPRPDGKVHPPLREGGRARRQAVKQGQGQVEGLSKTRDPGIRVHRGHPYPPAPREPDFAVPPIGRQRGPPSTTGSFGRPRCRPQEKALESTGVLLSR